MACPRCHILSRLDEGGQGSPASCLSHVSLTVPGEKADENMSAASRDNSFQASQRPPVAHPQMSITRRPQMSIHCANLASVEIGTSCAAEGVRRSAGHKTRRRRRSAATSGRCSASSNRPAAPPLPPRPSARIACIATAAHARRSVSRARPWVGRRRCGIQGGFYQAHPPWGCCRS